MNDAEILHFNLETRCKILHSPFPLNSFQNQQQKTDHAEILHFNLEI